MGAISDKLAKLFATKNAIKTAIISKGQSVTDEDPFSAYPDKIAAIETGIDTSDATATAADVRLGKTFYANGAKKTGTIRDVLAPTPSISVSSAGLITASATQIEGYAPKGTRTATHQLATQGAQTITPGTTNQTIASGQYLTGTQTIKGDANLISANIKAGVSIFGVAGSLEDARCEPLTRISVSGSSLYIDTDYNISQLLCFLVVVADNSYMQYFVTESDTTMGASRWLSSGGSLSSQTIVTVSCSGSRVTVSGTAVNGVSSSDLQSGFIYYMPA